MNFSPFFDKEVSLINLRGSFMRMIFQLGGPIEVDGKVYKSSLDRKKEQEDFIVEFLREIDEHLNSKYGKDNTGFSVNISNTLWYYEAIKII